MSKVIWTNGCFDIIHRGHIELFKYAKSLGDILYVGLDSDNRIKKSKGKERPINILEDRVEVLKSIKYIDNIVTFATDFQLEQEIKNSKAKIIVVGSDYQDKKVIGSSLVSEVKFYRKINDCSTTKILQSIASR
tara:strand:+ start:42 stop:443 length:402 start_codon:yes stop_codon:yes gene_type:complete